MSNTRFGSLLAIIFLSAMIVACKEEPKPEKPDPVRRKSPIAIASITHKPTNTYVKIVYGQPYKKGRKIFDGLVPYGQVWRTGANEATEMTATGPLMFNHQKLEAGTYGLFTIPGRQQWTIILSDSLGQWGAFDYKKKYDHLRTTVPARRSDKVNQSFSIQFTDINDRSSAMVLKWDTTRVDIPISFLPADTNTH